MPKRKYQTPEIMHDAPLTNHKAADFHFDDFAATFARLIANYETETPLAIGINGAWGSGKTSLLLRVKNMLDEPKRNNGEHRFAEGEESKFRNCKTVWFDAWKYGGEDQILAALLRGIVTEMQRDGFWNRLKSDLKVKKEELRWFDLLADSLLQFASAGTYSLNLDDYRVETPLKQASAFFDYFDDSLTKLLSAWVGERGALVIFIDDLDRCMPDKTVQVLEAIKLFLDKSGCVFVLGADIKIVQAAVETHYRNVGITGESAKDYLEKIIQIRFDLPPIVEQAMQDYLKMQDKAKVDEAMLNRWQALVAAAEVNPRRVKNVINDLNLQWFMAVNSGQAEGVNRDDFICWQALMRSAPEAFVKQITDLSEFPEIRHDFVLKAVLWQQGTQEEKKEVEGQYAAYKDFKRFRGVLKKISFSGEFTHDALNSMIYMSAPPSKPEPEKQIAAVISEKVISPETVGDLNISVADSVIVNEALRLSQIRDMGVSEELANANRLTIGGLDFMRVPAGKFVMGSKDDNELAFDPEKPQHTIDITYDYWVAKFNVTNEQYSQCLGEKKHPVHDWQNKKDHPVVNVSWDDAMKYCQWFNERFKSDLGDLLLRLPTESEWEKAARGAFGNEWPWGNEFAKSKCNSSEGRRGSTSPVGAYVSLGGDSPYGCADMVGNVWEWTHTLYLKYPYETNDGRENEKSRESRVIRGGSFDNFSRLTRCAFRNVDDPNDRNSSVGFRVCVLQKRRSL